MKFTPSAKFLRIAKSSSKVKETRAYFRKTESLSVGLESGAWIDATTHIDDAIPDATAQIEYELGQFSADSIEIQAKNILWWDEHIFNASASEHIECKIVLRLGDDPSDMAADKVYYFTGIVDKDTVFPSERDDSYSFTVDTADVVSDKMFGEFLTTQYYDASRNGVVLFNIPGVYVVSTNTGTNPLSAGIHTIGYTYEAGISRVRLDDGDPVEIEIAFDGEITIGNGTADVAETEQLTLGIRYYELSQAEERTDEIIIQSSPAALPTVWYTGISLRSMLRTIYSKMGITSSAPGLVQFDTYDGTRRMSMLEFVADGQAVKGASLAIASGTEGTVYAGNANHVFSIDLQTGIVTLLCSFASGHRISKLLYNERNGHLWILHGNASLGAYGGTLSRFDIGSSTLNAPVTVDDCRFISLVLFDFVYTGGAHEYCLLYAKTSDRSIVRIDGTTRAVSVLFTNTALGYGAFLGPEGWNYAYQGILEAGVIFYRFQAAASGTTAVHQISFDTTVATAWSNDGQIIASLSVNYSYGAYDPSTDTVYAYDQSGMITHIRKHAATNGASFTLVYTLAENDFLESMYHDGSGLFFSTTNDRQIHRIDGSGVETYGVQAYTAYSPFVTIGDITYGIDTIGRMFQVADTIELFLGPCNFGGKTVKNALTESLRACNCVGTISASKNSIIYPRGDSDGTPVTSGHRCTITVTNAEDIQKGNKYGAAIDLVEIDNGIEKINFNGTNFNVMPAAIGERLLQIENKLIPTSVIRDYLYMFYQFFKTAHTLYTFPVAQSLFHIEPMDGADVTFNTTKIKITATNCPIYSATYSADDGTMILGVLV